MPRPERITIAVDLAKSVFEVAVSRRPGKVAERHRLSRVKFLRFFANHEPATVLLEACASAHHWARELQGLGHDVVLLPPHRVRTYRQGDKTDRADAKALLEGYRNEDMLPVPIKTVEQQSLTALHRLRSTWVAARIARMNAVRGLLREFGYAIPMGARQLVPRVLELLDDPGVPERLHSSLAAACFEIVELKDRAADVEKEIRAAAKHRPVVQHLQTIPGIGVLTATALVAFVGDIQRFPTSRRFASYLGLVPREWSSGPRRNQGRITKRGNVYLRKLLVHGARSVLWATKRRRHLDSLRTWAASLERAKGHNTAAVALANKMARIAWVVWRENRPYREETAPVAS